MIEGPHSGNTPSQKRGGPRKATSHGHADCFHPVLEALVVHEETCHLPDMAEL